MPPQPNNGIALEKLTIVRPNGKLLTFEPNTASGRWQPKGKQVGFSSRLSVINETKFERINGRGSAFIYDATPGAIPQFRTKTGRLLSANSPSIRQEVIRRDDALRQVLTPQTLTDVVILDDYSYEVRLYKSAQRGVKNADGLYHPSGTPFAKFLVENPTLDYNRADRVRITTTRGEQVKVANWEYVEGQNAWNLYLGEGADQLSNRKTINELDGEEIHEWKIYDVNNKLINNRKETITKFAWGKWMTKKVLDPNGSKTNPHTGLLYQ